MKAKGKDRGGERGMSMVEVLVAITILVIAVLIALLLYDASRKSFKKGENVTEQQQAVRIAFDRLNSDLRMAGFNTNPDGVGHRPDEQIEAAFDTAVVFRADFDTEDPTASLAPETTLAGGAFESVSTGNDEVVLYALARPDGTGPDSLTFDADMQESPRDGDVETVTVDNLVLVQNPANAPYTLYRITFSNNPGNWGGSSFVTRTPLVENVRSMQFKYYDLSGNQINSVFDLTDTAEDIGGDETPAAFGTRSSIRRIEVHLEGLTREPDLGWVDPNDPHAATRSRRKFELTADVTPRNLGLKGIQDLNSDFNPPSKPATPTLGPGHCGGLLVDWTPNPPADDVSYYTVSWGLAAGSYSGSATTSGTFLYISGLTTGTTYHVVVDATDAANNTSVKSDSASATVTNTNTPSPPDAVAATSATEGEVEVSWAAVTTNTGSTGGDPQSPRIRDLKGYRVYRDTSSGFTPSAGNRRADETTIGAMPSPSWIDTGMVACRPYHWKVTAVDACGVESAPSTGASGAMNTSTPPAAPVNLAAYLASSTSNRLTWDAVTRNASGQPIAVDAYRIYRSNAVDATVMDGDGLPYTLIGTDTDNDLQYIDNLPSAVPVGQKVFYRVTAIDDCPNESAYSNASAPSCAFAGTVAFTAPTNGQSLSGVQTVVVRVDNPSGIYTHLRVTGATASTSAVLHDQVVTGTGPWSFSWVPPRPGPWTLTAALTNDTACVGRTSVDVVVNPTVSCCLAPQPTLQPVTLACRDSGSNPCREVSYFIKNNNCLTAAAIESMEITWTNETANDPRLSSVLFDSTTIWNAGSAVSPATNDFTGSVGALPQVDVSRNTSDPLKVTYLYTQEMSRKQGPTFLQNQLTTTWNFVLLDAQGVPTEIRGTCGPGLFDTMIVEQHN